jgi:predicted transcriptional regulator
MMRSKLEAYIDILNVLAFNGELRITDIIYKSNVKGKVMIEQLEFLLRNSLVEEKLLEEKVAFAITTKGINVLKFFGKIDQIVPIEEEKKIPLF